jgi:hypothetical protein
VHESGEINAVVVAHPNPTNGESLRAITPNRSLHCSPEAESIFVPCKKKVCLLIKLIKIALRYGAIAHERSKPQTKMEHFIQACILP